MSESPIADEPSSAPQLPPRRWNRRSVALLASVAVVLVAGLVVALVLSFSGGSKSKTVSIGVTDGSQPYWKTFAALAKKKLGVNVKYVNFTDYSQPNPALKEKRLDLNQFQHIQYLADYNVTAHDDLQPVGATAVYPLPLYSLKYESLSALPDGAKVAIPNDEVNEARALLVLQAAKLLTLKDGGTTFSSTSDVTTHKVELVTLDASQTARAVQSGSVAASVVNNNFATSAKLSESDAIFQDDPKSAVAAPYVNVFASRAADKDDPTYRKLAALYQDPSVQKGVQKANGGTAVFRKQSPGQLRSELAKVEKQAEAAKK